MVNDDIEAIISRGEARTNELNSKYEGLTFEDLSNFKSEASVQQWEGEDFRTGVCFVVMIGRLRCLPRRLVYSARHSSLTPSRCRNESAS